MSEESEAMDSSGSVWDSGSVGLLFFFAGNIVVLLAVIFGMEFVTLCTRHHDARALKERDVASAMAAWDGVWYHRIASEGYAYHPDRMSNVAFFPLFPLTARCVAAVTTLTMHDAMLLTSHGYLAGAFWLAGIYLQKRRQAVHRMTKEASGTPKMSESQSVLQTPESSGHLCRLAANEDESRFALLAMALYPTTFYLRMSYSESSFLCVSLLALLGMTCRWPTIVIAAIIGVATSSRSVGVALILPFLWHLWCDRRTIGRFLCQSVLLMPLCVSGLAAFMIFQWQAFGDPLAFVQTHTHWYERMPPESVWERFIAHITLEPLWRVYDSTSPCCWSNDPPNGFPLFSMQFMNPVFVLTSWIVIGWGVYRRQLSAKEILLSLGLVMIPYLTHNYRSCCTAEGRLACVIFPFYIVLGQNLSRLPRCVAIIVFTMMGMLLSIYSALFVQWYWFY